MTEEEIDKLREVHASWGRGDWSAGGDLWAPDAHVSWEVGGGFIVAHGYEDITRKMREFLRLWKDFRSVPQEFAELGDDALFVAAENHGTGSASGVRVDAPVYYVWRLRDGRAVRMHAGFDRDEVLRETGFADALP